MALSLCATAFGIALLLGHLLPVRPDSTSWATLELLTLTATALTIVVARRRPVVPLPVALTAVAILTSVGGLHAAQTLERRRSLPHAHAAHGVEARSSTIPD